MIVRGPLAKKDRKLRNKKRTKVITLRLDPIILYFVELESRRERRTVTSLVESAIEMRLRDTAFDNGEVYTLLWHTEEADRVVQLALFDERLLTYDEQRIWLAVKENPMFWRDATDDSWTLDIGNLNRQVLRDNWGEL